MKGSHTKHILLAALMGLAALPLCFAPPLLLLLPGFFGFIVMAWGPACLGVAVGASALCVFLVSGAGDFTTALLLLGLYLPASLMLCYCLIRRRPWRSAALGGSLAMALGLYALLCLPSLLSGNGPFGDFEDTFRLLGEQLVTAAPQLGAPEALVDQIKNYSAYLQLSAPSLVTGTIVGIAMFFGFFAPLIARGLCKAAGVETRAMARFENWQLGRSFMQGLVVLLIGALVVTLLGVNNAGAVVSAVECIAGGPLVLMGLCFIAYMRLLRKRGAGYLVIMYGSMVLLLPLSIYILVTLGILDRLLRIRSQHPVR
ncbi:MAG: DUF2232 domain-containing protein [Candidatus Pelethousia sp.]|nr:DUF2232 domain-containing protein [Candidatus Pelethousia sp.]